MAHVNPAFVIASSELAISNGQEHYSGKFLKGTRPGEPEGSADTSKCKQLKNMIRSKWKWSWVFNGVILLSLGFLIVIFEFDIIPFRVLGYECDDPSLSHKFRGDTIPFGYLIVVSVVVPLIAIVVVEIIVNVTQVNRNSWKKRTLYQTLNWFGQFFLGLLALLFLIQLGKSIIAEPRPHFFDTCKPDKVNCTGYVTDYKCTNQDLSQRQVRDSFRSFPSGHSALGFYVAVFMGWFFQSRIPYSDYLLVPWLQCMFMAWGLLCALTRITDRRHHWWDVLVGSILGILVAIFTVKVFCKSFRVYNTKFRKPDKSINEPSSSVNSWYKKMFSKSSSSQQTTADDRELREIK